MHTQCTYMYSLSGTKTCKVIQLIILLLFQINYRIVCAFSWKFNRMCRWTGYVVISCQTGVKRYQLSLKFIAHLGVRLKASHDHSRQISIFWKLLVALDWLTTNMDEIFNCFQRIDSMQLTETKIYLEMAKHIVNFVLRCRVVHNGLCWLVTWCRFICLIREQKAVQKFHIYS